MRTPYSLSGIILAVTFTAGAGAAFSAGAITIHDGWIRALPAGVPSGGYFTLHNGSGKDLVLTGAASRACGMLMLHKSENMGGMSKMEHVAEIPVPQGQDLVFAPGGYHLMCMDAKPEIKPGAKVPVTLSFKDGTQVIAVFAVRNAMGK